jgi:deoxyribonuclease V
MNDEIKNLESIIAKSESMQLKLASKVQYYDDPAFKGEYVTGIDVSYRYDKAYACAIVTHIPTRTVTRKERIVIDCEFPYIPGHFYLREGPAITKLLEKLDSTGPILIDGNGVLHPRRMGLASYIGVTLDKQTIGVAKSLLLGSIGERVNNIASILEDGEEIGAALWIEKKMNPIYVSIGHRISLKTAIEVVLISTLYGYPESLRRAHLCSNCARGQ